MKLSIAIATHNEEENIIRTLESVYDWVDEIVIVDGDSTDNTIEIIKKFDKDRKIKGYKESNPAMFHINKQKAIERCTGEWILQLDADEVVSPELKKEVLGVIASDQRERGNLKGIASSQAPRNDDVVAYRIPRLNYFLGKPLRKGGQYPDYTLRLYKNGVAKFPCKDVHEQVDVRRTEIPRKVEGSPQNQTQLRERDFSVASLTRNDKEIVGYLKAPLLHYPYKTFTDYLTKWIRYCELEADILYKKNIKPSWKNFFLYILVYPDWWFVKTFIRNRGYVDGFPGFIFSVFSALRYRVIYTMLVERHIRAKGSFIPIKSG